MGHGEINMTDFSYRFVSYFERNRPPKMNILHVLIEGFRLWAKFRPFVEFCQNGFRTFSLIMHKLLFWRGYFWTEPCFIHLYFTFIRLVLLNIVSVLIVTCTKTRIVLLHMRSFCPVVSMSEIRVVTTAVKLFHLVFLSDGWDRDASCSRPAVSRRC